jgi:protein-tyrosine phosphatase
LSNRYQQPEAEGRHPETFGILVVCTGNICRSPLAERLLQAGLDEVSPGAFAVSSAGTFAHSGNPAQTGSLTIAAQLGVGLEDFRARQLVEEHIAKADLVLVLARSHRPEVLALSPSALKRTFTLREFARILDHIPLRSQQERTWAGLVAEAYRGRHHAAASVAEHDDVTDPYRLGPDAYDQMTREMLPSLSTIIEAAVALTANQGSR